MKTGITVLIIDDRADNRAVLIAMLGHRNYRLLEASSGEQALQLVRQERPDLVIADVLMPKMDGYEFVQCVRREGAIAKTRIVFYTASYIEEESRSLAKACGVEHMIIKPAEPEVVFKVVDAALGAKPHAAPPPPVDFEREHLRLVNDKLAEKVEELEQLARRLESLRRRHELILNSAGEGIYGVDLEGKIIFQNPKAAELLGWKTDDLLGKPAHATIHHKHADGSNYPVEDCPIYLSMRDSGTRRVTNDVFWRGDGSCLRVDYVTAPIREENGHIVGSIVTFKDITEQFIADARLRLQQEQYRLLFRDNPNAMWVFEVPSLRILAVNEAAIAQYGYTKEEFLELSLPDLRKPEEVPELRKAISRPNAPAHFSGEFEHKRKDGSVIRVAIYSSPVVWDGKTARMVTAIDITERKRAEERLREQAEMLDRAHDAIIVRNFHDRLVTFWNNGAERLYGWSASEAIGRPINDLVLANPEEIESITKMLLATGEFRGEIKEVTKDGRDLTMDVWSTLVRDREGEPRSVLSINTDITQQKKLEMQLLRAQRLESIGTLASGVAHDLNNILTPILMCAEVLREDVTDADLTKTVVLIEESARRGANIVKQVLTFARGVEGDRVMINPRHLIDEMVDIAQKTFPKSIEVSARYPEQLWSIEGDPTQLHQVLLNLSVNARDAMPNGGSLVIAGENVEIDEGYATMTAGAKVGPHVLLRVTDTGAGIPRNVIEKIFDPFFTTKQIGHGTGLGLSTALGIVKSHGGFLVVYSEPARGSTFKIFLPAVGVEVTAAITTPTEVMQGNQQLVLVVDDEESVRQVTRLILEKNNYRVLEAADGPEALATFAQQMQEIDLLLTDMMLPYMEGASLIRAIRKMKPETVFVACSGEAGDARRSELQNLNVAHVLAKPYDTRKLLQTLHDALSAARL